MGRDKLPLKVGTTSLLDRVHAVLSFRCEEVFVVGRGGRVPAGTRCISDLRPGRQGPLAGIEAGLLAARRRAVFVAAGDMPFLTSRLVGYLLGLLQHGVPAVVPVSGEGSHPLCAAYDGQKVLPVVGAALDRGARSVRGLLEDLPGTRYVGEGKLRCFGDPDLLLLNVNSPEDLARARRALDEGAYRGGGE